MKRIIRDWERTPRNDRIATHDRRVTRRLRLSILWAVLTLEVEAPQQLAIGVFATFGAVVVNLIRLSFYLWSLV